MVGYTYLEGLIFLFGALATMCAILIPLAKLADWLQKKLDEWNEQQDQQLNNQQQ